MLCTGISASRVASLRPRRAESTPAAGCRVRMVARAAAGEQPSLSSEGPSTSPRCGRRAALIGLAALAWFPTRQAVAKEADEAAVDEYNRLDAAGKLSNPKELERIRSKYGFMRKPDGRVYLKHSNGRQFAVRLDMEVPGAMLFRDQTNGEVYALQTTSLQQIDLTSDQVVILLLGDQDWESAMTPITFDAEDGSTKTLTLTEYEFRSVVGLIADNLAEEEGAQGAPGGK